MEASKVIINFTVVNNYCIYLFSEKVAIKILDKTKLDQKTQRLLSREISNMEKLHHPNVIRIYEVVETLAKLHIIMEYAGGGELFTKISNEGKLPESDAKVVFAQVLAAVQHMASSFKFKAWWIINRNVDLWILAIFLSDYSV